MTLQQRLEFCTVCSKRKINLKTGLVCGLTDQKPAFEVKCEHYERDEAEDKRKLEQKLKAAGSERTQNGSLNPKTNKIFGIITIVLGTGLFLFSLIWGGIMIASGVAFLLKGIQQEKILADYEQRNKTL